MSDVHETTEPSSVGVLQVAGPQKGARRAWRERWRRLDRIVAVIYWLILVLIVIGIVDGLFGVSQRGAGSSATRISGFANLTIMYEIHSRRVWPDRVEYVVVAEDCSNNGVCYGPPYTCMFLFADGSSITFQPKRGETVWVDEEHHVASLGRILDTDDIANLEQYEKDEGLTISSPEEFLEVVAKLRAESAASAASADAAGR